MSKPSTDQDGCLHAHLLGPRGQQQLRREALGVRELCLDVPQQCCIVAQKAAQLGVDLREGVHTGCNPLEALHKGAANSVRDRA